MESSNSPNKTLIAIIVVVLLVAAMAAVVVLTNNQSASDSTSTSETASDTPTGSSDSESSTGSSGNYEDGTYSATGSYQTPGGQESIGVKVTLADGVITDAQVTSQGKSGESQQYQGEFISSYKSQVVGKKISEVSLSRVAGSSLTSGGFNDALADIEKQAEA